MRILMRQGDLHINAMVVEADIPVNRMSALLFELEMKGSGQGQWWVVSIT